MKPRATSTTNGAAEPTESTSLLSKDATKPIEVPAAEPNGVIIGNGDVEARSGGDGEGREENPLFEGNPEMARRMYLLFPAVAIGIFLSAADQTIIVSSYGKIGSDLNALNNTSWIATAYFLTLTSFQPLYGKLSDIFGRKPALIFAYSVFGTGCLFCGLARNLQELVAARAFAGIGGGGMTTVVSILFSDVIPLRERGTWQGYMNVVFAAGASTGAPLGGLLSDSLGWRWAFLAQFPLCLLAIITVSLILHLPQTNTSHWRTKLLQIDFAGSLTLISAVSTLLIGLDLGSNISWTSKLTLSFCLVSIPLFAIFIFVEMRIASHPFAPGHIIFEKSLLASYLSNFFAAASYMSVIFYIPLYFQAVDGLSATGSGLRLIPVMLASVSGSLFGGQVMQRTGRYYWLTVSVFSLSVAGSIVIFLFSGLVFDYPWGMIAGLAMCGFGTGAAITTTLINVIANADAKDQAVATACTYLFRSLGSVVGISISATVVQQRLRTLLRERLESGHDVDKIVERVRQSLDYIKELAPATRDIVKTCYQMATSTAFGMSIAIVFGALVSACFIREKKLSR